MTPADRAWVTLGAGILGWDLFCNDGDTLSERVDDYLTTHPILTRAVIAVVAVHLANAITPRYDPIHRLFLTARRTRTRPGAK